MPTMQPKTITLYEGTKISARDNGYRLGPTGVHVKTPYVEAYVTAMTLALVVQGINERKDFFEALQAISGN